MKRNRSLRFRLLSLVRDMNLAVDVFPASPAGDGYAQSRLKPLPQVYLVTWERLQPRISNAGDEFMGQQRVYSQFFYRVAAGPWNAAACFATCAGSSIGIEHMSGL